nr:FG-GAP repeat protein [Kofleriaceae bacterium]
FDASVSNAGRANINAELAKIEDVTPIDFVDIGASESGNYVEYRAQAYQQSDTRAGWADQIGMNGGEQSITFNGQPSSDDDDGTIIHETLHAVGLFHEQSRPDRDDYVVVDYDCIDWSIWEWENSQVQYEIKGDSLGLGPYDYNSIMHYGTGAFCQQDGERPAKCDLSLDTNGDDVLEDYCATVLKKDPAGAPIIFRRSAMSVEDINSLFRMYGRPLGTNLAGDHLGTAIAVGDFDNDGYDDLAVGAPAEDYPGAADAGQVFVYKGTSARLVPWQVLSQAQVGGAIEAGDGFGAALAVGDLDEDGRDDLVVGWPGEDVAVGGVDRVDAGAAAIFRGTKGGLVGSELWTQSTDGAGTPDTGDRFGAAVAVGNFAASPTVVIGAPGDRNPSRNGPAIASGAVFLFPHDFGGALFVGNPTRLWSGVTLPGDGYGATLVVGRLDDDGITDLAVGAADRNAGAGAVFVYRGTVPAGPSTDWSDSALAQYAQLLTQPGAVSGNRFGAALAIGNVRYTLRNELAVGAPGTNGAAGAALIYTSDGTTLGATLSLAQTLTQALAPSSASEAGDEFGAAIAIGDYRGGQQAELAIGAPGEDNDAGAVTAFEGGYGAATGLATYKQGVFIGGNQQAGDRFGSVLAFGHVNASGENVTNDQRAAGLFRVLDLLVAAPGDAPLLGMSGGGQWVYDAQGAGAVYAFFGSTSGSLVPTVGYHQEADIND